MTGLARASLALALLLLYATAAHADYTAPDRVRAIEQARSNFLGGATFVSLASVRCAFRGDGFFVLPNDAKQGQQLDMLLTARIYSYRVVLNFLPGTCNLASVGLCPSAGAC